ncbi:iron ABC transporter substrate-binding protein [Ferrovibrio sp.]|uniref:iron ABC transporter substrate-binding protein n=1 Tax=Ferrovibrio sp. TaxID=1917215 RepID=UPI001B75D33B|nr:iron ABC transporter substrate-binding protein [Ferrovibrio sp.]MBP7065369.1 iron ABC transporter substrate-binding protein [Ferrovibrio sp.]
MKRFTRRSLLGAALALQAGGASRAQPAERSLTDDAGRRVLLPARVERIFAAGPPASILLHALAPEKLIGWTTPFREAEKPFMPPAALALPALGRLTGRGGSVNLESLLAARPDLIFDYGTVSPTFASLADRVQAQTGIPYILLDGALDKQAGSILALGAALGETPRATALSAWVTESMAALDTRQAGFSGKPPRVYYGRGPRGLDTGMAGSINTELIERLGAVNVAAALGRGGLAQVSVEQVLAWAPDIIITIDPNFFQLLRDDPIWRNMPAVRAGRCFLAPNLPFGWIDFPPGLNRLLGLDWLARRLYPALFNDDPHPFVREAYRRLYHREPDTAQLAQLLA